LIGGTVALESAPGAGTALRVDMPLAGELAPADTVVAELIAQWNARVRLADRVTRVGQAVRAFAWPAYMLAIWLGVYTIAQLGPAYSAWREPALWLLEAGWLVLFAQLAIEVALALRRASWRWSVRPITIRNAASRPGNRARAP
jgi:hypothetical protein